MHPVIKILWIFIKLAKEFQDETFVMMGKGISISALQRTYPGIRLPDKLILIDTMGMFGELGRNAFLSILKHSKFSILTSYYEAFGYVILESLSLDVPVVGPDIGGPGEIVTRDVGMKYRFGDFDDLIKRTERMLKLYKRYHNLRWYVEKNYHPKIIRSENR